MRKLILYLTAVLLFEIVCGLDISSIDMKKQPLRLAVINDLHINLTY